MPTNAEMKAYRKETINKAERTQGLLAQSCTQEFILNGNEATFLVSGSQGNGASTRGSNGNLAYKSNSNAQNTVALKEYYGAYRMNGFDVFASQGNQVDMLQKNSLTDINVSQDDIILAAMAASSTPLPGAAVTLNSPLAIQKVITALGNAKFPQDGKNTAVISPAAMAYLTFIESFASADYVDMKPVIDDGFAWEDVPKVKSWAGFKWIAHPGIAGLGTAAEKMYFYHEDAIGYAANTGGMVVNAGYNEEENRSFANASCYMGAGTLQTGGIIEVTHDATALTT